MVADTESYNDTLKKQPYKHKLTFVWRKLSGIIYTCIYVEGQNEIQVKIILTWFYSQFLLSFYPTYL